MGKPEDAGQLRPSGYVGWLQEFGYGLASPLYDLFVAWAALPLGGERKLRRDIANWLEARAGDEVLSLCCGTGATDRALLELAPGARITGIDMGRAQLWQARRKDTTGRIAYRLANAAATGLDSEAFDRILLVGALHEMPRALRGEILAEAGRLIRRDGHLLVFEVPGNPETKTTRDLLKHGLDTEVREAGFEPLRRHRTSPDWFEAILARPA